MSSNEGQLRYKLALHKGHLKTRLFSTHAVPRGAHIAAWPRDGNGHQAVRNPTGSFSGHRFWRDLRSQGLGVAKDAVHAMLAHIQDAFLISVIPIATNSERKRNSNPRKIFPVDPGLIGAFDTSGRPNLGHALETAVLNELESRKAEVGYVRTDDGLEVDFRVRHRGQAPELIQVCADLSDAVTLARELRALRSAAQAEPSARQLLLVMSADVASGIDGGHVEIRSACDWMLEPLHPINFSWNSGKEP